MGATLAWYSKELDKDNSLRIGRFYWRRLLRIVPLFWVGVAVYMFTNLSTNIDYLLSNLLFINNFIDSQENIIPVGWSLVIEMQFYLLAPFILIAVYRSPYPLRPLSCSTGGAIMASPSANLRICS